MFNSDFFAPGSGIGPQSGGFSPTPADGVMSQLRQKSSQGLMEYALYTDPRARALSGLAAKGLAGDPNTASALIKNSAQGQLIKDAVGLAMMSGIIPGGNPMNLAANVQQMMSTQGFTLGGNIGRNGSLFGAGAITDQLARTVFDNIRNNFFDPVSGMSRRNAFGMDMTQMSQAMGQLTSRGAFAGMRIGDIKSFSGVNDVRREIAAARNEGGQEDYIKELQVFEQRRTGGMAFKIDKDKMKKVNDTFSDYAAMLRDARQIFGDLPISELTQNAERLIGNSVSSFGAISQMRNRLATISSTAAAYGLNPEALSQSIMTGSDGLQVQMYQAAMSGDPRMRQAYNSASNLTAFGGVAADISTMSKLGAMGIAHNNRVMGRSYGDQGIFMREFDEQQVSQAISGGMLSIMGEKTTGMHTAMAAQYALSQGLIKDPKAAGQVSALLAALNTAGTPDAIRDITSTLSQVVKQGGGPNLTAMTNDMTQGDMLAGMAPRDRERYMQTIRNNLAARAVGGLKDLNKRNTDFGLFGSDKGRADFMTLFTSLDKSAQDTLLGKNGVLNADNTLRKDRLSEIYSSDLIPGLADSISQDKLSGILGAMASDPTRANGKLSDQLNDVFRQTRQSSKFMDVENKMTANAATKRGIQSYLSTISMGGSITSEDFATQLVRGFFGTSKVNEGMVLNNIKNRGGDITTLALNADKTGLNVGADKIGSLASKIGGKRLSQLYADLGIKEGDTTALAAALNSPRGFKALQQNMGDAMGAISAGGFNIVSGAQATESTGQLETEAMMVHARRLLGSGFKPENVDLKSVEGRSAYHEQLRKGLGADGSKRLFELADEIKNKNYGGTEFDTLAMQYKQDPQLSQMLKDEASKLYDKGGESNIKKGNDLRRLDNALNANDSGKFLGILELTGDSMSQIRLFQN